MRQCCRARVRGVHGIVVAAHPFAHGLTRVREEDTVAKEDRGFASMDPDKQREIASKGGRAAHQKRTAHEWTSEEARAAGRKGGVASHQRKQQQDRLEADRHFGAGDQDVVGSSGPA